MKRQKRASFEFHGFAKRTHVRCEDCDLRGDLSTTGKPLVWIRICRCSACSGRGELPLHGLEQLDPYARKTAKPAKYMVYKPWDVECRSNANAAATARFDAIARIMEEPPGGEGSGRYKTPDGTWTPLEIEGSAHLSIKRYQKSRRHGTRYVYGKIGCRCAKCRAWRREYDRVRRTTPLYRGSVSSEAPASSHPAQPSALPGGGVTGGALPNTLKKGKWWLGPYLP